MYKLLLVAIISSIILSCGSLFSDKGRLEKAVGSKIHETCEAHQECSIKLGDVTWFDWDSMIVFSGGQTAPEINQVLGKEYFENRKFGFSNTFVFLMNGEIVYTEENFREIERNSNGDIYFSDIDPATHYRMYPRNGVFEMKRQRLHYGEYYSLQCKNCSLEP